MFYKIIKDLSEHFQVFAIDVIGMGSSTREQINFDNLIDAIDYYTESIENFRKSLGIESLYIAGHSLGGYFAGIYTLYYP